MEGVKRIHFVGVGGTGTGSLAVALAEAGYEVTGSDGALYEPMKSVLTFAKIRLIEGYHATTAAEINADLVIIGNVVRKENAEARAWLKSGARCVSFPEAVRTLVIGDRHSIVCAGTHGKTSTTSWIAFMLRELGKDPSYLIGGVPKDLPQGCLITQGEYFVGEGDEYDSAFFDKGPKFLHYNPHTLVLAFVEFDHADIYRDLAHVKASFEKLVALLPGDGLCVARYDDPNVMEVVSGALCPVQTFGMGTSAMWRIGKIEEDERGFNFEIIYRGRSTGMYRSPLFGEHNLLNILSGIVVGVNLGIPLEQIRPVVEKFHGARRRQEVLLESPILLVDDFAHHPTEVAATLKGVRRRFPSRKIWAIFEPRSATARRAVHQEQYAKAFDSADQILVSIPFKAAEQGALKDPALSTDSLVNDLKGQGKNALSFNHVDEIVKHLHTEANPGDIAVVMSNGEFGKIQSKIVSAFA